MADRKTRRTLGAVLYPDFEILDLYGPLEMFGSVGPELEILTVAEAAGPVASAQGPKTVADWGFDDCPRLDLVLVPGGIGTFPQLENARILDFLRARSETAELMMSVCSGSALLAKAGLLDGRRATTNKQFFDFSAGQSQAAEWVEAARWVEDGPVATSSGVSAGIDMALAIIARLYGRDLADEIAAVTEYEWQDDASRDPFHSYLNRGDVGRLLATFGRDPQQEVS